MSYEFKVGQKVVCVADGFDGTWSLVPYKPKRGEIYTIRRVADCVFVPSGRSPVTLLSVWLAELENPSHRWKYQGHIEIGFPAKIFRPLVSDTQPWLKEILEKPPTKELTEDLVQTTLEEIFTNPKYKAPDGL